ncbi:MAG: TadE/TadG family type IV pilus assembly protein [Terriglobales bacterium]
MKRRRRQEGVTVVLMALVLVALCGMAALAVDVGLLLSAKNATQNAADAAALAGAFTFLDPANAQPAAARNAAIAIGGMNPILEQNAVIAAADVSVDTGSREVTVTVERAGANAVPMFFARVLGIDFENVAATATAVASPYATGSACLRPIFVPNTILSSEAPAQACTDGQTILGPDGQPSAWLRQNPQVIGALESLRPTKPSGALAPSQFYSLDFGSGASTYSCTLGSQTLLDCGVSPGTVSCGSSYPTENGNMVGPTEQGIGTLIGAAPDTWLGPGAYESASGSVTDTSPQLVVAPVWDNCNNPIGSGKQTVTISGFSNWFIQGMSGSNVTGYFVNAAGCAGSGGTGGGAGYEDASFGIPVHLVHPGQ